jgi:TRAP-type C4-dicarboxylate transport system substrate-binding protein
MEPQEWCYIITRGNLNALDDAETQKAWDRVKERTDGLLTVTSIPNGALPIAANDQLRAVSEGQLEMFLANGAYHVGDFPLLGPMYAPYLTFNQLEKAYVWQAARPVLERELNKINLHAITYIPYAEAGLWAKYPVDIMNMDGIKMRSVGRDFEFIVKAMRGTPVEVAWPEVYTALQTGLVDTCITGYHSFSTIRGFEQAPYCYNIGFSNPFWFVCANKEKWDSLPADVQVIIMEELSDTMTLIQAATGKNVEKEIAFQMANGLISYEPTPPEGFFERMAEEVTKPRLAESLEAAGPAGLEMIEAIEAALGRSLR